MVGKGGDLFSYSPVPELLSGTLANSRVSFQMMDLDCAVVGICAPVGKAVSSEARRLD